MTHDADEAGVRQGTATADAQARSAPPCREVFERIETLPLVERYRTGSHWLDRRVLDITPEALHRTFDANDRVGEWSCQTLLGHLADAELVNAMRFRRTLAEEAPSLADWDEQLFIDRGLYAPSPDGIGGPEPGGVPGGRPPAAFVAVIHTLRLWMGQFLASVPERDWSRVCLHQRRGEMTLRGLLEHTTWHLEHHAWFLQRKLERLGVAEADSTSAGCGPACRCVSEHADG